MANPNSKAAVIMAISGNAVITVAKGTAAFFSGSGAMLAECIHSAVDTLNQCLLLIGHQRSLSKPTARFPYGFGPEASFWGLLAAIGVLIFGGALTIQHGIHALSHPEVPGHFWLSVGVLTFAALLEAWITWAVLMALKPTKGDKGWWEHIKTQDPGTITVVLEDSAAVIGCLLALTAIILCHATGDGIYDAIAQLFIGTMLALVGLYLIWKNRGLLIGQAIAKEKVDAIQQFIADFDCVDQVVNVKSRQLSAHHYRIKAEIVLSGGEIAEGTIPKYAQRVIDAQDEAAANEILGRYANALFIEQAKYIDKIEQEVRERFPGAVFIDLEPHYHGEDE